MSSRDASHRRYSAGSAALAFGLAADGRLRHVNDVAQGLACACVCPACQARLIARRPNKAVAHFAHESDRACATAVETMLHLLAKEILEARRRLVLPAVEAAIDGETLRTHGPKEMTFDSADLEVRLDGVIPDILVRYGPKELLVEIYVTHRCGDEKIERLRALGLPAIEIDLRSIARGATRDEVEAAVLQSAPRKWLFNAKLDSAREKLAAQIARRAQARREQLDRTAGRLARNWDRLMAQPYSDGLAVAAAAKMVATLGFEKHLGLNLPGQRAISVPPRIWQGLLFKRYVVQRSGFSRYEEPGSSAHTAAAFLKGQGLVDALFEVPRTLPLVQRVKALRPEFRTPAQLVTSYFDLLERAGVLESTSGVLRVVDEVRDAIDHQVAEAAGRMSRAQELKLRVESLLLRVDAAIRDKFDFDRWCATAHRGLPRTPVSLSAQGGADWEALCARLADLERAFQRDETPANLIGLPLGPALAEAVTRRAAEAERLRLAAEARALAQESDREGRLNGYARSILGFDADPWLDTVPTGQALPRRRLARTSDEALSSLLRTLDAEAERRQAAHERAIETDRARGELRRAAMAYHGDRAELFLHCGHPALDGERPHDICLDEPSLRRCLSLIPGRHRGSRR